MAISFQWWPSVAVVYIALGLNTMQTPEIYLQKTESAVRKLFEGIEHYVGLLQPIKGTTFVGDGTDPKRFQEEYDQWARENASALEASLAAQRKFSEESFAMATLCGAVLQVAAKAIECFSTNNKVPEHLVQIVGNSEPARKFCFGRELRGLPIGLIIYAGRNQHTHFNDQNLSRVNTAIFERLAQLPDHPHISDPALDLSNSALESFATNITFILGWRSYEDYLRELQSLLLRPHEH